MSAPERLLGEWRLTAGGRVDPVRDDDMESGQPGIEVHDDGRTSDLGALVSFRRGHRPHGSVDIDVGGNTIARGAWRAAPNGVFLAASTSGEGPLLGERRRPRPWLSDAVSFTVEDDTAVLRDDAGELTAAFERLPGSSSESESASSTTTLPPELVPVDRRDLLGPWEPDPPAPIASPNGPAPKRWQNLEFRADGWWHAFPVVNIGGGPWRWGPGGTLLTLYPYGRKRRGNSAWRDLDPWLLPVVRAGFDGPELVLLDDHDHELQRLRRLTGTAPLMSSARESSW